MRIHILYLNDEQNKILVRNKALILPYYFSEDKKKSYIYINMFNPLFSRCIK
jgi:hypothetical protein